MSYICVWGYARACSLHNKFAPTKPLFISAEFHGEYKNMFSCSYKNTIIYVYIFLSFYQDCYKNEMNLATLSVGDIIGFKTVISV